MAAEEVVLEAIFRAAEEGAVDIVAGMLDEDPGLLSSVWDNITLLTMAVGNGHVCLVRLLLERRAEINQANEDGSTALDLAVFTGDEEMVSILLSSGADPSRKGYRGRTTLMSASMDGPVAVVRLLLRSMGGRGLDERDADGNTALWSACAYGHADVVRVLLLEGADHTIADNHDRTPLQIAEQRKPHECVAVIQVSTSLVPPSQGHRMAP
jgi:ankyrin repeat protein